MIKLIVTDLDGTLLDDQKTVDPSFWEIHRKLVDRGVIFIAATGRQYYKIEKLFSNILEDIILLAENGTYVKHNEKELMVNELDIESARMFIKKGRGVKNTDLILCGKNSAYCENTYDAFVKDARQYYERFQVVDDLLKVEDTILKVTLWDKLNAEKNAYPHFSSFEKDYKIAVAGDVWLDITSDTASKGFALKKIQQDLNIQFEETLIFGDYLNDADMMSAGYYSYAMKNAHPRIRELSRFITQYDNNNNGVVRTIEKLMDL